MTSECIGCDRKLDSGEEVLIINDGEYICENCIEEHSFTTYSFGREIVATENDAEFGTVIYEEPEQSSK